ncbi:MAG: hypothetical protein V4678_00845 [Patescibacteria group bacterium]
MDNIQRNPNQVRNMNEVAAGAHPRPAQSARAEGARLPRKSKRPFIVAAIVLGVLLAAAVAWMLLGKSTTAAVIDSNKYQAVFFTNGQVYFGKLSSVNGDYMRLNNVYYLQNKTAATDETSPQSASAQDASDVELIKLGNEIHGPEDEMLVSKDQILFFENLKPAGTVSQTISNFQKNK